jgi:hypothetical protein
MCVFAMNKCIVISFLLFESFLYVPLGRLSLADVLVVQLSGHHPVLCYRLVPLSVLYVMLWCSTALYGFLSAYLQAPVVDHISFKGR